MKKIRIALWIAVAFFAALLGALVYTATAEKQKIAGAAFGVPFELTDGAGRTVTQADFTGKPTALFFGFTHCPEVCPTTLYELNGWMEKVDPQGKALQAYFVTVDPERDTPEIVGQYVYNVSKRIVGLSGAPDKVMDMVKGYRVYAKKVPVDESKPNGDYSMDHTASVFLLDAQGRFKSTIAYGENADTAVKKLENLVAG